MVRTYGTPNGVALDLIDTGCGMDEETRAKVFEAFFSTKRGGSGLGLPTTRRIIEGHGGQISLQSEPGRGTQVTITLPVLPRLPARRGRPRPMPLTGPIAENSIANGLLWSGTAGLAAAGTPATGPSAGPTFQRAANL